MTFPGGVPLTGRITKGKMNIEFLTSIGWKLSTFPRGCPANKHYAMENTYGNSDKHINGSKLQNIIHTLTL